MNPEVSRREEIVRKEEALASIRESNYEPKQAFLFNTDVEREEFFEGIVNDDYLGTTD